MKKFKLIFIWAIFSIVMQCLGLFLLDRFYFKNNSDVKSKTVEIKTPQKKEQKHVEIPTEAKEKQISFSGKYVSYFLDNELWYINTETGDSKKVESTQGVEITKYIWLSDRNRVVFTQKEKTKKGQILSVYSYDVDKGEPIKIADIAGVDSKSVVTAIESSAKHNGTYIKIEQGNKQRAVYRINIMHEVTRVQLQTYDLGDICVVRRNDRLVYNDVSNKGIYVTQPNKKLNFKSNLKTQILGIDGDSLIYIGQLDEDKKVTNVIWGSLDKDESTWEQKKLDEPISKEDIYINNKGQILFNNSSKSMVIDCVSKQEYKYEGEFMGVYNGGIVTLLNNKIYKTQIEK